MGLMIAGAVIAIVSMLIGAFVALVGVQLKGKHD